MRDPYSEVSENPYTLNLFYFIFIFINIHTLWLTVLVNLSNWTPRCIRIYELGQLTLASKFNNHLVRVIKWVPPTPCEPGTKMSITNSHSTGE